MHGALLWRGAGSARICHHKVLHLSALQGLTRQWHAAQSQQLTSLASLTAGTVRLLAAAAAAETASGPRALLSAAASKLGEVQGRIRACTDRLAAAVECAVVLPQDGLMFMPPAALPALKANSKVMGCA